MAVDPTIYTRDDGNYFKISDRSGPYVIDDAGVATLMTGGGGGGGGGGGLTNTELRATPVPVSGPATDAQMRATPIPVSGTVSTSGLTDTQLRATPVPISGTVTIVDAGGPITVDGTVGVSGSVAVTGPATDAQMRATPIPVSGTVSTGGLTDTQLRATAVPVSGTVAVTSAALTSMDGKLPAKGVATSANSQPVVLASDDAQIGTKVTAVTALPTGGTGLIGWLSNIWNAIATQLPATLGIKTAANSLSVAPASDALFVLATSAYSSSQTITRPANVTPYSANDVVGGAITFTNMAGAAGGRVMLTSADLRLDIASIPSGMTSFRLYLYNVTPPSALADNAAWDLPSGDRAAFMGYVDLGTPADLGSTCFLQVDGINAQRKLGAAETSIYGYLVTNGGYTPAANSEVYNLTLRDVGL